MCKVCKLLWVGVCSRVCSSVNATVQFIEGDILWWEWEVANLSVTHFSSKGSIHKLCVITGSGFTVHSHLARMRIYQHDYVVLS